MSNREVPLHDLHASLEELLIDQYLESVGRTRASLRELPPVEAAVVLGEATRHATLRLAEIESRAHYTEEIHRPS
jgi:hypothetical protein